MKKLLTFILLLVPSIANAVEPSLGGWGYNKLSTAGGGVNLGSKHLEDTVGSIINIFLSFLGVLTTVIILYGGFKWMTSGGNADKVGEAKKLIGSGIIGLIIVLTSYIISRFVLDLMYNETVEVAPAPVPGP